MKQLLILSGKGGTGKTTVAGAFISLSHCRSCADCDVDAPNLQYMMRRMKKIKENPYTALGKAVIDGTKCTGCGLCEKYCRFGAIRSGTVDQYECEGCGVCERMCPQKAVRMVVSPAGTLSLYRNKSSVFSTARLTAGSGTSGKLVAAVKKQLSEEVPDSSFTIIDGSPGTGCPVMASLAGADIVLVVTEPTESGIHDLKRIVDLIRLLNIDLTVCINKYDINLKNTEVIESYCKDQLIPVTGRIPFDTTVLRAVNSGKTIDRYSRSAAGKAVREIWNLIVEKYSGGK
ncbi:MAG: ATP-binding protein [Treponema sp.]|nr:ATP-binding protein [Treponema sp.]